MKVEITEHDIKLLAIAAVARRITDNKDPKSVIEDLENTINKYVDAFKYLRDIKGE